MFRFIHDHCFIDTHELLEFGNELTLKKVSCGYVFPSHYKCIGVTLLDLSLNQSRFTNTVRTKMIATLPSATTELSRNI